MIDSLRKPDIPLFTLCTALFVLSEPGIALAQGAYETPPELAASTVLPPQLVQGEHFRVLDGIRAVDGLYDFTVEGTWNTFEVQGEAMLRLRIKELEASIELANTSSTAAGVQTAGVAAQRSVRSLGKAIAHPVQTAKGLPGGIVRMFASIGRDVGDVTRGATRIAKETAAGGPEEGEESEIKKSSVGLAKQYTGISKKYREWAQIAGVDPYTSNPILRRELNRLGAVSAAADFGTTLLMPVLPGALGLIVEASTMVYLRDWREIFQINAQAMKEMGVDEATIQLFEANDVLTPSSMTLIVALLQGMNPVEDRKVVIQQATFLETESEALFFLESLMLAEWYHRSVQPLRTFLFQTLIPVAMAQDGSVQAFTAADVLYWTEENHQVASDFTSLYADYSDRLELWAADYVSPLAQQNLAAMGWTVSTGLRSRYEVEIPWGAQDE